MKSIFLCFDRNDYSSIINDYLNRNPEADPLIFDGFSISNAEGDVEAYSNLISNAVIAERVIILSESYPRLDDDLLVALFSFSLKSVIWINSDGDALNMKANLSSDILFVFPGPIVPLNLGSHQRAYNLLSNLKRIGYGVDLLIPEVEKQKTKVLESSLLTVCENVYFYKNKKKKFRRLDLIKRGVEKKVRQIFGKNQVLQDKFSERCFNKPTFSLKKKVNSLYHAKNYSTIIISYAWMMDALDLVEPFLSEDTKVICDTHDVQFERAKGFLSRKERIFFSEKSEKEMEIRQLNRADVILSISKSDKKNLEKENLSGRIINLSAGFNYQSRNIKRRPVGRPMNFGFIGGSMDANVRSLDFVIKEWWPIIKQYSPDSVLYVAGSVAKNEKINKLMLFDEKIVGLGFVKNLDDFYNLIDVSLNPVLVQGGLNFKSVEAVFAGKHLLTNHLGKECLGNDFLCEVIEIPSDITAYLSRIEFDLDEDKRLRKLSQDKAKALFSNENVIKDFEAYLSEVIN